VPTIRKNMADINSSDQALNGLKIKSDTLPDDWYVTLVNPKSGEPGENMTIARFCELLTDKMPVATNKNKGLLSSGSKVLIDNRLVSINPAGNVNKWNKVLSVPKNNEGFFSALISGNKYANMNPISEFFNFQISDGVYIIKTSILSSGSGDSRWRYTDNGSTIDIYIINNLSYYDYMIVLNNDFSLVNEVCDIPSDSKRPLITNFESSVNTLAASPNALTETIVEEVPVSADTPMTLEETGQPVPTMRTVERYEYSIQKMAEMILSLRKELDELKGGTGKE